MDVSSGRNTPTSVNGDDRIVNGGSERIEYEEYPLTPLGQLLDKCMTSGVDTFPHPSVSLQYFEIAVRYVEFWKARAGSIPPIFAAMLDTRCVVVTDDADISGIHQTDELVRRRCFYLFARFVKECRGSVELNLVGPLLDGMRVSASGAVSAEVRI